MTTSSFIRRYLNGLQERQIFETFDVLIFGTRQTVDFVLKEQVEKGRIVRLARGIYMRGDATTPLPSPEDLAAFVANSLGSVPIFLDGEQKSNQLIFLVNGTGCSFKYGEFRIVMKTISKKELRKLEQQQTLLRQPVYPP